MRKGHVTTEQESHGDPRLRTEGPFQQPLVVTRGPHMDGDRKRRRVECHPNWTLKLKFYQVFVVRKSPLTKVTGMLAG